jgi:hypothetical protein
MAVKQPEANEAGPQPASPLRWFKRRERPAPADTDRQTVGAWSPLGRLTAAARRRYSRADIVLFASGIALSAVCAFFPWYVFFNQQQFGIRGVKMDMPSSGSISTGVGPAGRNVGLTPVAERDDSGLDNFTTGTLAQPSEEEEETKAAPIEQPFPAPVPEFDLVHVANGRAMIQDDMGLFVVQRGSLLPDNTRVASIEQRNGRWVVVTSGDRVLEIKAK